MMNNFELLPNEILVQCFEYLTTLEIFHSFNHLNHRLNTLIRNIRLHLNFENVRKKIFDEYLTDIVCQPDVKKSVYSLKLSNRSTCGQIDLFFQRFSLNEFPNLQILSLTNLQEDDRTLIESMQPLILPRLRCFYLNNCNDHIEEILSIFPIAQLQTLSVARLTTNFISIHSITKLRIHDYHCDEQNSLFRCSPQLRYLHIGTLVANRLMINISSRIQEDCAIYLKDLIIDEFEDEFVDFQMFAIRTPNLRNLTISASNKSSMIDADDWQTFIQSSLTNLNRFNFIFHIYHGGQEHDDIIQMFNKFQSQFWQIEHQWITEYILDINFVLLFTIPFYSDKYQLTWYKENSKNPSIHQTNIYDKVIILEIYDNLSIEKSPHYFSNVKKLSINNQPWRPNEKLFTLENINHFKAKVNLISLNYLDLSSFHMKTPVLLQILKDSPNLSEMMVDTQLMRSLLNDQQLHSYLGKMIKTLHLINLDGYHSIDNFYDVFSSLENLSCSFVRISSDADHDFWTCLISHISRFTSIILFGISTEWICQEKFFCQLLNEETKRNIIHRFVPSIKDWSQPYETTLQIWIDDKII